VLIYIAYYQMEQFRMDFTLTEQALSVPNPLRIEYLLELNIV